MDQVVHIRGADWAGHSICGKFTLNGTALANGVRRFKTVEKMTLPVRTPEGRILRLGYVNKFGLYYRISAASDVTQQERRAPDANSYTIDELVGTVDAVYRTVTAGPLLQDGLSVECAILTSS